MIECPTQDHLRQLLGDHLSEHDSETLVDHLGMCEACRNQLQELSVDGEEWHTWERRLQQTSICWDQDTPAFSDSPIPNDWPEIRGYEVLGVLGHGGMGVVFKACHLALNRIVALKMLRAIWQDDAEFRKRFQQEAETLAHLQHPNLVQIHNIVEHEDSPLLALEYVDGHSLSERFQQATMAPTEAARLVEILARAVQSAHDAGVLHRDIKPANILLAKQKSASKNGHGGACVTIGDGIFIPKVTDFGLARRLEKSGETQPGDAMGTPSYMAPEQARADKGWSRPAVDVYALGALLYEALTGRPPFRGESAYATLLQVVTEEPVPPSKLQSKLPRDLETICLKCLNKDHTKRYGSAVELADDLRRFQAGEPIRARRTPMWRRTMKWTWRHPVLAASLMATFLAVVTLLTVWIRFTAQLQTLSGNLAEENKRAVQQKLEAEKAKKKVEVRNQQIIWDLIHYGNVLKGFHRKVANENELKKPQWKNLRQRLLLATFDAYTKVIGRYYVSEPKLTQARSEGLHWAGVQTLLLGDRKKALYYLQRSVHVQEGVVVKNLGDNHSTYQLGTVLSDLAYAHVLDHRINDADRHFRRAIEVLRAAAVNSKPANGHGYYLLALTHRRFAHGLDALTKNQDEVEAQFRKARAAIANSLHRQPHDPYFQFAVALEKDLQRYYTQQKRPNDAKDAAERAKQFQRGLDKK